MQRREDGIMAAADAYALAWVEAIGAEPVFGKTGCACGFCWYCRARAGIGALGKGE